ncbi:AAA family ATPase [Devosia sp. BSSL-BM10]|uniref:AAA family ATPase n=1 Tax=Devosia litorisediminis TaxID=2829817 RepID=A0A942EAB1_9HYPH|nr:AAA family ATPase [Devosia litorisediminis]MBS3850496.1 AAA family ATPase [Devosia litorisediminis]
MGATPFAEAATLSDGGNLPISPVVRPGRQPAPQASPVIAASPFQWREATAIPPRQWLYGKHLIRKFVSVTIAPGGVGKSTLGTTEALAMAAGQNLLGDIPHEGPLNVWVWGGEDPLEELERRSVAAMQFHGINPHDLSNRLFIDSGRHLSLRLAAMKNGGAELAAATLDALEAEIRNRSIDVLILDPLVSTHDLDENANGPMDRLIKALAAIADRTACAIELVHHSRKLNGTEADADSARGGSAIIGAVRSARVLNPMSADIAKSFGIEGIGRRSYVRIDDAKANLAPPGVARWMRLQSVGLGNGVDGRPEDWVAVAASWTPPDMMAGVTVETLKMVQHAVHQKDYRASATASNWAGHAIASLLNADSRTEPGKSKIKRAIKEWLASGALTETTVYDGRAGRDVPVIEVGQWVD